MFFFIILAPGLVKFVRESDAEIDWQVTQVFILNILRFEYPHIISLL